MATNHTGMKKRAAKHDPADIQNHFAYDAKTGKLFWRVSGSGRGYGEAGAPTSRGYRVVGFKYRLYYCHQIAWVCHYGVWPEGCIGHINRNKSDNRIKNLRDASCAQNRHYAVKSKNNTSGYIGVCYNINAKRWQVGAKLRGVNQHIGMFDDPKEGAKAYDKFVRKHRGKFAITNFKY